MSKKGDTLYWYVADKGQRMVLSVYCMPSIGRVSSAIATIGNALPTQSDLEIWMTLAAYIHLCEDDPRIHDLFIEFRQREGAEGGPVMKLWGVPIYVNQSLVTPPLRTQWNTSDVFTYDMSVRGVERITSSETLWGMGINEPHRGRGPWGRAEPRLVQGRYQNPPIEERRRPVSGRRGRWWENDDP